MPSFSDDDVLDFMVTEAVILRAIESEKDNEEAKAREEWKRKPVGSGTPGIRM